MSRPSADTETLRRLLLQDRTSDWGDASVDDIEEEKQELVRTVMTEDGAAFRHNEMEDTRKLGLNMVCVTSQGAAVVVVKPVKHCHTFCVPLLCIHTALLQATAALDAADGTAS